MNNQLSPEATKLWKSFVVLANTSMLHQLDEDRFGDFCAQVHADGIRVDDNILNGLLGNFSEEFVKKICAMANGAGAALRAYDRVR